jgi:hypothetical protein
LEPSPEILLDSPDLSLYEQQCSTPEKQAWLNNHETWFVHAFARVPAIHNFWWVIFFLAIAPSYCPEYARLFLTIYFCYNGLRVTTIAFGAADACRRIINTKNNKTVWSEKPTGSPSAPSFRDVVHSVILCQYAEPIEKLEQTLQTLATQTEGLSQQIVVTMATESRDPNGVDSAQRLRHKFKGQFKAFYITKHTIVQGEAAGKSSNENWAARCTAKKFEEGDIDIDNVVITSCDADTFFDPGHFAELTYRFCASEDRYQKFWQTPIAHIANIFQLPMICQARYLMVTMAFMGAGNAPWFKALPCSTYALSMRLCKKAGFWDPQYAPPPTTALDPGVTDHPPPSPPPPPLAPPSCRYVSEDYHMYVKCFFVTKGQLSMDYMWRCVGCDAPITTSNITTFKACFQQHTRWMLGAVDLGYYSLHAWMDDSIPWYKKAYMFGSIYEFNMLYVVVAHFCVTVYSLSAQTPSAQHACPSSVRLSVCPSVPNTVVAS